MSTFGKSFSRELGKNAGKFVSNKVFGTAGWATPRRHIIDIEDKKRAAEERKAEREQNRADGEAEREARREAAEERRQQREIEKQEYQEGVELRRLQRKIDGQQKEEERVRRARLKEIARIEKEEEIELKRLEKEIARLEKEQELELQSRLKEKARIEKEEEIQSNFDEHENFERYLETIQSVHEVSIEKIDWESLIDSNSFKVLLTKQYEWAKELNSFDMISELENNSSGENFNLDFYDLWLDIWFEKSFFYLALYGKLENGKLAAEENEIPNKRPNYFLHNAIKTLAISEKNPGDSISIIKEIGRFIDVLWTTAYARFIENKAAMVIFQNIIAQNSVYYSSVSKYRPFDDFLKKYGSSANYCYFEDIIDTELFINIEDVIPNNKTTLTAAGVLSSKPFSNTERNALIKNYVSSISLRLALEMFAVFPVSELIISVIHNERSSKTGHFEDLVILSVNISRKVIEALNLDYVNPSEALTNFKMNINYSNSNGLQSVERINVPASKKIKSKLKDIQPQQNLIISNNDEGTSQFLIIDPNKTVSDLKNLVKEIFQKDIVLKTNAGNIAGDNRKLKALTSKEFQSFAANDIKDITTKTGIKIDVVSGKITENKISPTKIKNSDLEIRIEINKSMTVKDISDQFKKHFNKDVFVLSDKGNKVSENRRVQALTCVKIEQIFFTIDSLTKANLKKIKKEIGLHIDY